MPTTFPLVQLQPGATGDSVKQLQDFLVGQGYLTQAQVNTGYGTYGPQTTAAVLNLQKSLGIDYSSGPGYFGPLTLAAVSKKYGSAPAVSQNIPSSYVPPAYNLPAARVVAPATPPPIPAPVSVPAPTPAPAAVLPTTSGQTDLYSKASGYTGPSIVDFLSMAGQPYDKTSLSNLATQYGVVGNPSQYSGTSGQNTQLLNILKGFASGKVSSTGIPTTLSNNGATPPTPSTPIDINNLGGGLDLGKILGANTPTGSVNSDIAGLLSLYGASTESQKKYDEMTTKLTDIMGSLGNEGADLQTAMDSNGVGAAYQQVKELNLKAAQLQGELGQFDAETQTGLSGIEDQSIPTGLITGQQAQYQKQRNLTRLSKAAELSATIALSQAYQGNATLGMDLAQKSIELKYQPIQNEIDVLKTQLGFAKDALNKEDTTRSNIISKLIELKQNEITTQKNNATQILTLAIQAASNGAPMAVVNAIKNSPDPASAASAGSQYLKGNLESPTKPVLNGTGGGGVATTFSPTQLNGGASRANLAAAEFAKLDPDVQNFFVNNTKGATQFSTDLAGVKAGNENAQDVIDLQNSSNLPQAVKDYLNQQINAVAPSAKSTGGKVWWNPLTWFN